MSSRNDILLVDFSQLVIAACAVNTAEMKQGGADARNVIKHLAFVMLLNLKKKFNPHKLVLACDSKNYWRRDEFTHYKGHRKYGKEKSGLDWAMVAETLDEIKKDLRANFPYTVLEVDGAEADDVIAILTKHYQEFEQVQTGLIVEPRTVIICSTDGDFQQLQKYQNVKQWNNITKKMLVCKNPKQFLIEHIIEGDTGDNIPSITNGNDWAKCRSENIPTRAKPLKTSRYDKFYTEGYNACLDEFERINYKRNERLVDLDKIPENINNLVQEAYINYVVSGGKGKMFNYFTLNKMKLLLGSIDSF